GVLRFALPVLVWLWKSLARSPAADRSGIGLWWLMFLGPLPVAILYLASQVAFQSIFLDRYLIFTALPYYALVAATVYSFQPGRLRSVYIGLLGTWSILAGWSDLRTNRMAWEGVQMGSRVDWRSLTQRLVEAEPASGGLVPLYVLSVQSKGLAAGGWAIAASMGFFLDE